MAEPYGQKDMRLSVALGSLGAVYASQKDYLKAKTLLERSLRIREQIYPADYPALTGPRLRLGLVCWKEKDYSEAAPLLRRALDEEKKLIGIYHLILADSYCQQGKYQEAESLYRQMLPLIEKAYPNSPMLFAILTDYASVLHKLNKLSDAQVLERRAESLPPGKTNLEDLNLTALLQRDNVIEYNAFIKTREAAVRGNIRTVQIAAEFYIQDYGKYPTAIDNRFQSYFPHGDCLKRKPGVSLLNPFTNRREWPVLKKIEEVQVGDQIRTIRLQPGTVVYAPTASGNSYVIVGGGVDGQLVQDADPPTVYALRRDPSSISVTSKAKRRK
ncbi:MAG: tetratricopeptide repeat protein [Candidatus Obscuribacterales bacterium]|nr:tetratricopeptide repeat protein [Candidatus Obscuribacterales bacterium]